MITFDRTVWVDDNAPAIKAAPLNALEEVAVELVSASNTHDQQIAAHDTQIENVQSQASEAANQSATALATANTALANSNAGGSGGSGGGSGAADLGDTYKTLAALFSDQVEAPAASTRADGVSGDIGPYFQNFYMQVGVAYEGSATPFLFTLDPTAANPVYSSAATTTDDSGVYEELPGGITLDTSAGTLSGTPTSDTLATPRGYSSTWIFCDYTDGTNTHKRVETLVNFYIFPAS